MDKTYRLLTGPDNPSFCQKVSDALNRGYVLHGSPVMTSHDGEIFVGQAVVLASAISKKENQRHDG